jgi:hypothetical protein
VGKTRGERGESKSGSGEKMSKTRVKNQSSPTRRLSTTHIQHAHAPLRWGRGVEMKGGGGGEKGAKREGRGRENVV